MEEVHALSFGLNFPFCLPNFCNPTFPVRFTTVGSLSTNHDPFYNSERIFSKPPTSILILLIVPDEDSMLANFQ